MAGDVRCDVCGRTFPYATSGAPASTVRCPYCQMTVKLPAPEVESGRSPGDVVPARDAAGDWHVYTCDGQRYGPITRDELDRWAAEKRLTATCQVYQDGWPAWRMAPEFYPNLPPATAAISPSAAAPNVASGLSGAPASQNPYAAPRFAGAGGAAAYQLPHRGVLILVFGILAWTVCGVFALPAWIMGYADLQKMKAGEMDNSGYGMTMAGMVLGAILSVLVGLAIVLVIGFAVLATRP